MSEYAITVKMTHKLFVTGKQLREAGIAIQTYGNRLNVLRMMLLLDFVGLYFKDKWYDRV